MRLQLIICHKKELFSSLSSIKLVLIRIKYYQCKLVCNGNLKQADLRKAYDTINHTILIKKLEKYGIRGLPLQLVASYLIDRQQYTIVNQYKSKSRDVICGIPQGSNLGPLLFNIYINDLPLASNSTIHLFADDTNLTLSHSIFQHCNKILMMN